MAKEYDSEGNLIRKRGRPEKEVNVDANGVEYQPDQFENVTVSNRNRIEVQRLMAGISATSLGRMFGMHRHTVQRKLAGVKPLGKVNGAYVYAIPDAAPYLCKPVFDVEEYMKKLKPTDLPASLQKDYWQAMLNKQKWEENAGHLFRADMIAEKLGDVFKTIKNTSRLWVENIDHDTPLTDEQRKYLNNAVNSLIAELYDKMLEFSTDTSVPSQMSELNELDQGFTFENAEAPDDEDDLYE